MSTQLTGLMAILIGLSFLCFCLSIPYFFATVIVWGMDDICQDSDYLSWCVQLTGTFIGYGITFIILLTAFAIFEFYDYYRTKNLTKIK